MAVLIESKNLSLSVENREILKNINFKISQNESVYIVGENGAGKSSLLEILAGFESENTKISGEIFRKKGLKISYLIQDSSEWFLAPTVIEDIIFSLLANKLEPKIAIKKAIKIMRKLKISHLKKRSIYTLSGGEKRLVAIAGTLIRESDIFILDEPFHELDAKKIKLAKELLSSLNKPFIIVTHHLNEIEKDAKIYELRDGVLNLK